MPYYHVYLRRGKQPRQKEVLLFDLTRSTLKKDIIEPFIKDKPLFVVDQLIKPVEITYIKIIETKEKSSDLFKRVNFRRILGNERIFEDKIDKVDFLIDQGQDVTKTFLAEKSRLISTQLVPKEKAKRKLDNIFVVRGHDLASALELKHLLFELSLNPVILQEQPNEGRTIIERLLRYSNVGYAFVILTSDDYSISPPQFEKRGTELHGRPRQNVVFEYGLLFGILGSQRVCCLLKEGTEAPSDIQGLKYITFKHSISEARLDIINELKAAGYDLGFVNSTDLTKDSKG
jgi:predicted nucleotide-binding protein